MEHPASQTGNFNDASPDGDDLTTQEIPDPVGTLTLNPGFDSGPA